MDEEYVKNLFNECSVGRLIGIEILEVKEGYARGSLLLKNEHINVFGSAHGGIIFALADHVGGACGNTVGKKSVLIESSIQYFRPVFEGSRIYAEALLIHKGKKIGRIDIKVYNENSEDIALMHMVFYITNEGHRGKTS
ncbi:MAG TPA: PaaI family thioesterase [Syntrophorhabdaceae bacterium]|nr:PaaI family thioesterase [Syntrophorhabdaceae bacterium]HOT43107.1 PaaI family thioesterase [Syntrophorhabdaceae bacterium]HPC67742.1 PaaI family thioesterase [Syntrophorhabdaceae bacterium]HPP06956.1 PaaI family thioesterase [Syntrophorhabdaceae bacterium]HQH44259.1 PaaI family thioesterase [Syntrophorhabdaceae bacterium]